MYRANFDGGVHGDVEYTKSTNFCLENNGKSFHELWFYFHWHNIVFIWHLIIDVEKCSSNISNDSIFLLKVIYFYGADCKLDIPCVYICHNS